MPIRYWIPTTLWSSEYLKYLAKPGGAASACSWRSTSRPVIRTSRSLNTPSPASQPTVASA